MEMLQSNCKESKINNVKEPPDTFNHNVAQDESSNIDDDRYILNIRHSVVSLNPSSFNSLTTTSNKSDILNKCFL